MIVLISSWFLLLIVNPIIDQQAYHFEEAAAQYLKSIEEEEEVVAFQIDWFKEASPVSIAEPTVHSGEFQLFFATEEEVTLHLYFPGQRITRTGKMVKQRLHLNQMDDLKIEVDAVDNPLKYILILSQ